jgi:hypothetical protein
MQPPDALPVRPAGRFTSFEDSDQADRDYYRSLTPDERMAIVAELEARYRREHGYGERRLERVGRVARLGES